MSYDWLRTSVLNCNITHVNQSFTSRVIGDIMIIFSNCPCYYPTRWMAVGAHAKEPTLHWYNLFVKLHHKSDLHT